MRGGRVGGGFRVGFGECDDVKRHVFEFLCELRTAHVLVRVNREWHDRVTEHTGLWALACVEVWRSKSFVPRELRDISGVEPRTALRRSIAESARPSIDAETLCSLRWWFRFKRQAGSVWTRADPYWLGDGARELEFVMPPRPGEHGKLRWHRGAPDEADLGMRWRLEHDAEGTILRVKHEHFVREFPGVRLVRHKNWGFVFHSVWVVYASFPMSKQDDDRSLSDRALARTLGDWQWSEVEAYNTSLAED